MSKQKHNISKLALTALLAITALYPALSQAQIAGPIACNATTEGTIIYNDDENVMQFCNGTDWIGMGGGGTADNLGNHLATQTFNMAGNDINTARNITFTGTLTDTSDIRLKDNIKPLTDMGALLDKVTNIDTISFTMKDDESKKVEYGVSAQQLETVFPKLVETANDEIGSKSVNYIGLIAPLIEAVKELKTQNEALTIRIQQLEEEKKQ